MESVLQQIRQSRQEKNKRQGGQHPVEALFDGASVTMRFDPVGDENVMSAIQSMLVSGFVDSIINGIQEANPSKAIDDTSLIFELFRTADTSPEKAPNAKKLPEQKQSVLKQIRDARATPKQPSTVKHNQRGKDVGLAL